MRKKLIATLLIGLIMGGFSTYFLFPREIPQREIPQRIDPDKEKIDTDKVGWWFTYEFINPKTGKKVEANEAWKLFVEENEKLEKQRRAFLCDKKEGVLILNSNNDYGCKTVEGIYQWDNVRSVFKLEKILGN